MNNTNWNKIERILWRERTHNKYSIFCCQKEVKLKWNIQTKWNANILFCCIILIFFLDKQKRTLNYSKMSKRMKISYNVIKLLFIDSKKMLFFFGFLCSNSVCEIFVVVIWQVICMMSIRICKCRYNRFVWRQKKMSKTDKKWRVTAIVTLIDWNNIYKYINHWFVLCFFCWKKRAKNWNFH